MRPRPRLGLPALRAAELADTAYTSVFGTTRRAAVRQARRVVRSATHVFGTKVRYPAGVILYLSPSAPAQVLEAVQAMGNDGLAEQIAKPLRDNAGRCPRLTVWIESDATMARDFEVAVLGWRDRAVQGESTPADQEIHSLVGAVVSGWTRLKQEVPEGEHDLRWLEQKTGVAFRRLDAVRRVRNEAAHEDRFDRGRLYAALKTIEEAERRLAR